MKLNFVCLLALIFIVGPLHAQMQMYSLIDHPVGGSGAHLLPLSGGGYIANTSNGGTPSITKLDSLGQMVWSKKTLQILDMVESADGGFLLATTSTNSYWNGIVVLSHLDANGNIVWERQVLVPAYEAQVDQAANGDYVLALSEREVNPVIRIVRMTAAGTHISSNRIHLDPAEYTNRFSIQDLKISPHSGKIALLLPSSPTDGLFMRNHPTAMMLDSTGHHLWSVCGDMVYYSYAWAVWTSIDFNHHDDLLVAGLDNYSSIHCPGGNSSPDANFFVATYRNGSRLNRLYMGVTGNGWGYLGPICRVLSDDKVGVFAFEEMMNGSGLGLFFVMDTVWNVLHVNEVKPSIFSPASYVGVTEFFPKNDSTVIMWGGGYEPTGLNPINCFQFLSESKIGNPLCHGPAPVSYAYAYSCQSSGSWPVTETSATTTLSAGAGLFQPLVLPGRGYCSNFCQSTLYPFMAVQDTGYRMNFTAPVALYPGDSLYWDFGDGNAATGLNPSHVYNQAGNYTVCMVRYSPGCGYDTLCQTVTVAQCGASTIDPILGTFCAGDTVFASGAGVLSGTVNWYWDGMIVGHDTNVIIPNVSPGYSHRIVLETQNGNCIQRDSQTVTVQFLPVFNLADTTPACGLPLVQLYATQGASILWSTGATTQSILAPPGIHSVTVTNSYGCTRSDTTLVIHYPLPQVYLGPDTVVCGNFTPITLTGPGGLEEYEWNTGQTTMSIQATSPGIYSLSVTDSNGCSNSEQRNLMSAPAFLFNLGPDITACPGTAPVLTAYPGLISYLWSNGATTPSTSVTAPGTYSITVTNNNGCIASDNIQVSFLPAFNISLGPDIIACQGTSVTLNGPPALSSYSWNTGATTRNITVNSPGTYILTGTNANNCVGRDTVQVQFQNAPIVNLGPDVQMCSGASTMLTGPLGMAGYQWSNGGNTPQIIASQPGSYSLTVTGGNGCPGSDTVVVGYFAPLGVNLGVDRQLCAGATATLSGPMGMANYQWSTGDTVSQIFTSQPGTYSLTATDANGCSESDTINIIHFPAPTVNLGPDQQVCSGTNVTLSGPSGMAAYQWSNGSNASQIMVTQPGTYRLTVTDGNGCIGSDVVIISNFSPIGLNLGADRPLCAGSTATLSGPMGMAGYQWSTGDTVSQIFTSQPGTYSLTVTNAIGCSESDTVVISAGPAAPVAAFAAVQVGDSLSLSFTGTGGAPDLFWDFGDGNSSTAANPSHQYANPGNYTVCLIASNLCGSDTMCQPILVVGTSGAWTDGAVLVYPNPANGEFDIRLEFSSLQETHIELYNAVGQLMAEWKPGRVAGWQARCNATLWSAGVYALRVQRGERVWVDRLRVMHLE